MALKNQVDIGAKCTRRHARRNPHVHCPSHTAPVACYTGARICALKRARHKGNGFIL
jgi:hypothetical protein